jgi:hypothetical protein
MYDKSTIDRLVDRYVLPQLHPDLQPYVDRDELHHPLLDLDGGVYPRIYGRINKLYARRIERSIGSFIPTEWDSLFSHLKDSERIEAFTRQEMQRSDFPANTPEYFKIIGQIWTDPECLAMTSSFLELMLGIMHGRSIDPNVCEMMTPIERDKLSQLPTEFTVFRGHADSLLNGISWTTNINIALQYAIGSPLKSSISIGTANKSAVLAVIDRWDEDEIIIPSSSIEKIDTFGSLLYSLPPTIHRPLR